ncbi:hypothetical protein BH09BAC3_BH09BAC3_33190 [soil metagenome]
MKKFAQLFPVMKKLTILLLVAIPFVSSGQTGHKLDFKIKGLKDTTAYLGYFYGETTYLKDTAKVNSQGVFFFDGKERLPQGVYFFVLNKMKMFEFVVAEQQHFSLETSTEDYVANMKVQGDDDNRIFFENMIFSTLRQKEAEPFLQVLKDSTLKDDQKKEARESFGKLSQKVMAYQNDLINSNPKTLTARLLKMNKPIEIPDPPKKADGSIDSSFQLRYYRQHFFDNFDLADEAMLRLPRPFYAEKVGEYLDKLFIQTPDSIMAAIDGLVQKAKANQETYKFLVYNCVLKYQQPKIMGLDEVFVRLNDKYYSSGAMDFWAPASFKKSLKDYADKMRPCLIGKTGANLIMQDQNLQQKSMYDIKKKYTILYIFDPDCGHCRTESPKLVEFYNKDKVKFNLEVFAVSTDTSILKMKNYIKEMKMTWITVNGPRSYVGEYNKFYMVDTTPQVFILDDKKKIIAKGLPVDKLEDFFTNYEKFQQKKAPIKPKGT